MTRKQFVALGLFVSFVLCGMIALLLWSMPPARAAVEIQRCDEGICAYSAIIGCAYKGGVRAYRTNDMLRTCTYTCANGESSEGLCLLRRVEVW